MTGNRNRVYFTRFAPKPDMDWQHRQRLLRAATPKVVLFTVVLAICLANGHTVGSTVRHAAARGPTSLAELA